MSEALTEENRIGKIISRGYSVIWTVRARFTIVTGKDGLFMKIKVWFTFPFRS